jgi:hypothetical protein
MKKVAVLFVVCTVCVGCSQSSDHAASPNGKTLPPGDSATAPGNSTSGEIGSTQPVKASSQPVSPPETNPAVIGDVYPEKNEVAMGGVRFLAFGAASFSEGHDHELGLQAKIDLAHCLVAALGYEAVMPESLRVA